MRKMFSSSTQFYLKLSSTQEASSEMWS